MAGLSAVRIPAGARVFLFTMSRPSLGLVRPPFELVPGSFPMVKWPGPTVGHSPAFSV